MKYVAFLGTGGRMPPEAVAIMNRDLPGYTEEMERRGVRGFGRSWTCRTRPSRYAFETAKRW